MYHCRSIPLAEANSSAKSDSHVARGHSPSGTGAAEYLSVRMAHPRTGTHNPRQLHTIHHVKGWDIENKGEIPDSIYSRYFKSKDMNFLFSSLVDIPKPPYTNAGITDLPNGRACEYYQMLALSNLLNFARLVGRKKHCLILKKSWVFCVYLPFIFTYPHTTCWDNLRRIKFLV